MRHRCWLWLVVLSLALPLEALAAIRYVGKSNASNAGGCANQSTPCATIRYAMGQMGASDVLEIGAGTYVERLIHPPSSTTIKRSPSAPAGSVIIQAQNQSEQNILLGPGAHDIVFDGLVLDGSDGSGNHWYTGSGLEEDSAGAGTMHRITFQNGEIRYQRKNAIIGGGQGWLIHNNWIHDNGTMCCTTGVDDHGVYYQGNTSTFSNNVFHNPRGCWNLQLHSGDNHDNIIKNNRFFGAKCGALALDSGSGHKIINNVIHHESATEDSSAAIAFASHQFFYHNTIVDNRRLGVSGRGNNTYRNNIICGNGAGQIDDAGSSIDASNYISSACPSGIFVGPGSGDSNYRLTSNASDMINTVACLSDASPDPDGTVRPGGANCARGAYEFGGAGGTAVATGLRFVQHPTTVATNTAMTPAVTVRIIDHTGTDMPSASATISLTLSTNPGGSTLTGGGATATSGGTATFSNVRLNFPGTGYRLTASASGLTSAVSSTFEVTGPSTACSSACTVYVAPTGSDSQPCNAADILHPRATLAGGLSCLVVGGSTLYLRAGTYNECIDTSLTPITGGSSLSTPTTIAAYGTETVTLAPTAPTSSACQAVVILRNSDHDLVLDRLILDAGNRRDSNGLVYYPGAHHIRFQNGIVRNTFYEGVYIQNATDTEVINSTIAQSQWYGVNVVGSSTRTLLQNLTVTNHAQAGIQVNNGSVFTVREVTLTANGGCGHQPAVRVGGSGNTASLIANAVIYGNYAGLEITSGASGLKVYNSTVVNNTTVGAQINSGAVATDLTNNILTGNGGGQNLVNTPGGSTHQRALLFTNPGFADAPAGDFRLLPTATTAIDQGHTVAVATTDRAGVSRPHPPGGNYDIGAYECPSPCVP